MKNQEIEPEFFLLEKRLKESGCAKKQVAAGTYLESGEFVHATNFCEHEGKKCPRLHLPTGEGYHLCKARHAEINLIEIIKNKKLKSPTVWVFGHYYACEPCASALKEIGIKEIRVREFAEKIQPQRFRAALTTGVWYNNPEKLVRDEKGDFIKYADYEKIRLILQGLVTEIEEEAEPEEWINYEAAKNLC